MVFRQFKIKIAYKKKILNDLKEGKVNVIIGTHALISENVVYNNLSLVITDEQHRFGVNQRGNLKNKGLTPDILYMSATPIPRTYALTIYGDMDISSIHTMPSGRKEVITYLKNNNEIKDVLILMNEQLKMKHQIYVIAPLIEESEKISLENVKELYEKMSKAFGKIYNIGILHGKLNNEEKQKEEGTKQIAVLNPQLYVELAGKNYDKVDGGYFTTNNANGEKIIVALRVVSKMMYLIGFREAASNNALYCDQSMTVKFNAQGDIVDFGNRPIMFLPDNGKLNISYVYTGDLSINDYKLDINADYVDQLMKNSKKAFIKSKIFK